MFFQSEARLVDELRSSLEKQYTKELEKERDQWKKEETKRVQDEVTKTKEQFLKVDIFNISVVLNFYCCWCEGPFSIHFACSSAHALHVKQYQSKRELLLTLS